MGSTRASGLFSTQREAVKRASYLAQRNDGSVTILGRDGKLRQSDLPDKLAGSRCFISHSYQAAEIVRRLSEIVPESVKPVIFPRVEPDPQVPVSGEIIPKILECENLIYLEDSDSKASAWVPFERDYALRAHRGVFSYCPNSCRIEQDKSEPVPLKVHVKYHSEDAQQVERMLDWAAKERHFELTNYADRSTFGGYKGDSLLDLEQLLHSDGIVLWLLGPKSYRHAQGFYSEDFVDYVMMSESYSEDALFQEHILERFELESIEDFDENNCRDLIWDVRSVYARISSEIPPDLRIDPSEITRPLYIPSIPSSWGTMIDLVEGVSDTQLNWNRVDDLIVLLVNKLLGVGNNQY